MCFSIDSSNLRKLCCLVSVTSHKKLASGKMPSLLKSLMDLQKVNAARYFASQSHICSPQQILLAFEFVISCFLLGVEYFNFDWFLLY